MVGTLRNVDTCAEISDWKGGDTTYFAPLVEATAKLFVMGELSADQAYSTPRDAELVESVGAQPLIPFKKNVKAPA